MTHFSLDYCAIKAAHQNPKVAFIYLDTAL